MDTPVWAIPGFLGLPDDWAFLSRLNIQGVDLDTFAMSSLERWAAQFNDWIEAQGQTHAFLMGYSLGGRLALHALIDRPQLWKGAIIVSAHNFIS